jgi:hypothetical protein
MDDTTMIDEFCEEVDGFLAVMTFRETYAPDGEREREGSDDPVRRFRECYRRND